jgi:homoserine O-acetyltransferase
MTPKVQPTHEGDFTFAQNEPFRLDGGGSLSPVTVRWAVYGNMAMMRSRLVLVCHALSGSARVGDWWSALTGPGLPFDPARRPILCANILGSCYGTTGPRSINPQTGRPYGGDFPVVSINDMVRAQAALLDHLGVERVHSVVGGSIGGLQALAWAARYPDRVPRCMIIGASPLNAMGLALSHLQRQAIVNDPAWQGGHYPDDAPPTKGLSLARAIAMCSYKSSALFAQRFGRQPNRTGEQPWQSYTDRFDVGGYLDHQGQSFLGRFDAASYLAITRAMETYDATDEDLARVKARTWLVGIGHDWLFPPEEVRHLAERLCRVGVHATYEELETVHGHDGFLADTHLMGPVIQRALEA